LPQLDRFKQHISTTTVDGDLEETNRREDLARCASIDYSSVSTPNCRPRTFKKIEEESYKMSSKNAFARFADKAQDSNMVASLVEQLREAIISYQVGNCPLE
jgi:hypothetical protein